MFHVRKIGLLIAPVSVIAIVLLSIVLPTAVYAQTTTTRPPLSLTTSPIPLSVVTTPGKSVVTDLRVKNNSTVPERLKIELLKFSANGVSGDPQLHEREAKDTYFDWVSFSERSFVAEPGVWKTIHMTIDTPDSAAFGYYLAVLFSRSSPTKPTGGASAVEGGVASLVLLDVEAPGAKREAKVASLTADRKVYEFLPTNLRIRLKNSGNIHVAPTGSIFIKRGGEQVALIDFNTQRGNILPGSSRVFDESWGDGFPSYVVKIDGTKTTKTLKWDFSKVQKLRFGHYSATLVAVYDDGQRDVPIEATVGFWVIPWRIIGVLLVVLLLVGAGLWMILRSIWKKIHRNRTPSGTSGKPKKTDKPATPDDDAVEPSQPTQDSLADDVGDQTTEDSQATVDVGQAGDIGPVDQPAVPTSTRTTRQKAKPTEAASQKPKTAPELKD